MPPVTMARLCRLFATLALIGALPAVLAACGGQAAGQLQEASSPVTEVSERPSTGPQSAGPAASGVATAPAQTEAPGQETPASLPVVVREDTPDVELSGDLAFYEAAPGWHQSPGARGGIIQFVALDDPIPELHSTSFHMVRNRSGQDEMRSRPGGHTCAR